MRQHSIEIIDYDDWADAIAEHPELATKCNWDGRFLYLASEKFRRTVDSRFLAQTGRKPY
jgi:hypothetical protein